VLPEDADAEASLAGDMEFEAFCNERRDAFVAALETMEEPKDDAGEDDPTTGAK